MGAKITSSNKDLMMQTEFMATGRDRDWSKPRRSVSSHIIHRQSHQIKYGTTVGMRCCARLCQSKDLGTNLDFMPHLLTPCAARSSEQITYLTHSLAMRWKSVACMTSSLNCSQFREAGKRANVIFHTIDLPRP